MDTMNIKKTQRLLMTAAVVTFLVALLLLAFPAKAVEVKPSVVSADGYWCGKAYGGPYCTNMKSKIPPAFQDSFKFYSWAELRERARVTGKL